MPKANVASKDFGLNDKIPIKNAGTNFIFTLVQGYIQEVLGPSSSKTIEISRYMSTESLQSIKSPFDDL